MKGKERKSVGGSKGKRANASEKKQGKGGGISWMKRIMNFLPRISFISIPLSNQLKAKIFIREKGKVTKVHFSVHF